MLLVLGIRLSTRLVNQSTLSRAFHLGQAYKVAVDRYLGELQAASSRDAHYRKSRLWQHAWLLLWQAWQATKIFRIDFCVFD